MKPLKLDELTIVFGIDGILLTEGEDVEWGEDPRLILITPGTSRVLAEHYAHVFRVVADHFETIVKPWAEQVDAPKPTISLRKAQATLNHVCRNYGSWSEEFHQAITEGPTELPSDTAEWDY
ncbi:MAG: hypothetical protein WAS25_06350 [Geothrix sp.]|uniref:hypothetical protein n=1 Tax=Geothrix sp. TaxID=1962974 RepID=UPI003BAF9CE7